MDLVAGNTVLTGNMTGQTHLHGLLQRTQELGFELISIEPAGEGPDNGHVRLADRDEDRGVGGQHPGGIGVNDGFGARNGEPGDS